MAHVARHIVITGRVQGVFFRQSAADKARELGVAGWVRNSPDGSVEAHVEGEERAVEAMIEWLRQGPPAARVDRTRVTEAAAERLTGFQVRH